MNSHLNLKRFQGDLRHSFITIFKIIMITSGKKYLNIKIYDSIIEILRLQDKFEYHKNLKYH